jgi:hypothetical protein
MDNTPRTPASATGGFIKVYRCIQHNWLARRTPYCEGFAWIDLILSAAWARHDTGRGWQERGEVCTSQFQLSKRWGWTRKRVRNFLRLLQNNGMVAVTTDRARDTGGTRIRIVNYDIYQADTTRPLPVLDLSASDSSKGPSDFIGESSTSDSSKGQTSTHQRAKRDSLHKKEKKLKNEKKTTTDIASIDADSGDFELKDEQPDKPKKNGWALWHDANVACGRKAPAPIGKYTKAAKELLEALNGDAEEFTRICTAYLKDSDKWLVGQGHNLHVLINRLETYRNAAPSKLRIEKDHTDPGCAATLAELQHDKDTTPLPEALNHPKVIEAIIRWRQHKLEKNSPVTALEAAEMYALLASWGKKKAIRSIRYSIGKGWKSLVKEPVIPLNPDGSNVQEHIDSGGAEGTDFDIKTNFTAEEKLELSKKLFGDQTADAQTKPEVPY